MTDEEIDLSFDGVREYWQKTSPNLAKIMQVMENVEHWLVDESGAFQYVLKGLVERLRVAEKRVLVQDRFVDGMTYLLAYCSTSRALRLMAWLDLRNPDLSVTYTSRMKGMAGTAPTAQLMVDRLQAVESIDMMQSVFSPQRSRMIIGLLRAK